MSDPLSLLEQLRVEYYSMKQELSSLRKLKRLVDSKFTSGNSVPVTSIRLNIGEVPISREGWHHPDRIMITHSDWSKSNE